MSATYRRLLRREVVDICVLIFIADVVTGVQTPLFSLYTTSLRDAGVARGSAPA